MIFLVFIDGIGYGSSQMEQNPFAKFPAGFLGPLGGITSDAVRDYPGLTYLECDACLGVAGLPQSASGQTTLWTGINGALAVGHHVSGFPGFTLKKIIAEYSIIKRVTAAGKRADLFNCYTPRFKEYCQLNPKLISASSLIQMAAKRPFKTLSDLRQRRGLYMDLTQQFLLDNARDLLSPDDVLLNLRDPFEVGAEVFPHMADYDLGIFEYFLSDKAGHAQDWAAAAKIIGHLDRFIAGLLSTLDPLCDQLIISSDHGNLEDLSTKLHTLNPVPVILYGKYTSEWSGQIKSIQDVPLMIYASLGIEPQLANFAYPER